MCISEVIYEKQFSFYVGLQQTEQSFSSKLQGEAPGREKVLSHIWILPLPIKVMCPFMFLGRNNLRMPGGKAGGRGSGMSGSGAPAACSVAESIVWFMKVRVQSRQTFAIKLETGWSRNVGNSLSHEVPDTLLSSWDICVLYNCVSSVVPQLPHVMCITGQDRGNTVLSHCLTCKNPFFMLH